MRYILKVRSRTNPNLLTTCSWIACRFLPIPSNRRLKAIDKEIKASLNALINKREKAMSAGEDAKNDLLGLLLESNFREIQEHGNTKSVGMSTEDVIDECKIFYVAGQETTSVLLTWTMVLLAQYPNWQARAREEVVQVFGNKKPDFDGLNHLKVVSISLHLQLNSSTSILSYYC
jgi:cytochrome P450